MGGNLRIIGIEEIERFHFKDIENIFNKIIEESFPKLKKYMLVPIKEISRTLNRRPENRYILVITKSLNVQNKKKCLLRVEKYLVLLLVCVSYTLVGIYPSFLEFLSPERRDLTETFH